MRDRASRTPVEIRVYAASVRELMAQPAPPGHPAPVLDWAAELLDAGEWRRAEAFVAPDARVRYLVAHTLLRLAVADRFGTAPDRVGVDVTCDRCGESHGRPRFTATVGVRGIPAGSIASISTSGDRVLVAVGPPAAERGAPVEVGVDVQQVAAVRFAGFDEVALSRGEQRSVAQVRDRSADRSADQLRAALWARKEAIAKALGTGLDTDPRGIAVGAAAFPAAGVVRTGTASISWADVDLRVGAAHASGIDVDGSLADADVADAEADVADAVAAVAISGSSPISIRLVDATALAHRRSTAAPPRTT